ncbi:MAG: dihydrodipicolinate synthase family protein, partial [Verrucomicrobiales bacterium]
NKPSQEGLYQHYKAIASETGLPLMLYSVPGRSSIEIGVETTVRLAANCPNIVAIKEAGGSVERVNQLVNALPSSFGVLCGDDPLTLSFMVCGAIGLVSVASNIIPATMTELVNLCLAGDFTAAAALHKKTYPLMKGIMSLDVNPVPIKSAAALMGHCSDEFRLPLVGLSADTTAKLASLLREFELVK